MLLTLSWLSFSINIHCALSWFQEEAVVQHQSHLVQQLKQNHHQLFCALQVHAMHTHQWNHQIPASVAPLCHWGIIQVTASPVLISLALPRVLSDPRNQGAPLILFHHFSILSNHRYMHCSCVRHCSLLQIYQGLMLNYLTCFFLVSVE